MKRAYGYTRSATGETSHIQIQQMRIKDYCIANRLKLVEIFDENKASGVNAFRNTALNELLFKSGKKDKVDAVIVADSDRLARNTEDRLLIKKLLERKGIELIAINDSSPSDKLSQTQMDNVVDEVIDAVHAFETSVMRYRKRHL